MLFARFTCIIVRPLLCLETTMDESNETETSLAKEITIEVAKAVAVTVVSNVAGIGLFIGIGLVAKKIQDRKARKETPKTD
ncbi:membrane protein [Streptomyces phage Doxi13]|nr:membrane protein [Streptomyces phage Doxi13]